MIPNPEELFFGCPYHGLVTNGQLTLPNSTVITYPQPSSGNTIYLRSPSLSEGKITRSGEEGDRDIANGWQWRRDAVLSGYTKQICGKVLGGNNNIYWDGNGRPWRIRVEAAGASANSIRVVLVSAFGVFSPEGEGGARIFDREILGITDIRGGYDLFPISSFYIQQNRDGSKIAVITQDPAYSQYAVSIHELTISGNGDINTGSGISCSIAQIKNYSECYKTSGLLAIIDYNIIAPFGSIAKTCDDGPGYIHRTWDYSGTGSTRSFADHNWWEWVLGAVYDKNNLLRIVSFRHWNRRIQEDLIVASGVVTYDCECDVRRDWGGSVTGTHSEDHTVRDEFEIFFDGVSVVTYQVDERHFRNYYSTAIYDYIDTPLDCPTDTICGVCSQDMNTEWHGDGTSGVILDEYHYFVNSVEITAAEYNTGPNARPRRFTNCVWTIEENGMGGAYAGVFWYAIVGPWSTQNIDAIDASIDGNSKFSYDWFSDTLSQTIDGTEICYV